MAEKLEWVTLTTDSLKGEDRLAASVAKATDAARILKDAVVLVETLANETFDAPAGMKWIATAKFGRVAIALSPAAKPVSLPKKQGLPAKRSR